MAKYQAYAEYKDSGVEFLPILPSTWKVRRVKSILDLQRTILGEKSKYYQLLSLTLRGVILRDVSGGDGKIPESFDTYQAVKKKDLVFCLFDMDETPRTVGISEHDGMITGAYNVYKVNKSSFPKFIYYYFLHLDYFKGLKPFYTGLRKVVRSDTFANIKMPCPPLAEQTQIANFLDHETAKIDHLIEKQQQLIELLKEKRQAVISHAVTKGLDPNVPMKDSGVEWLGEVPEHWEIPKLLHITTRIGDGLHSTPVYQEGTGYYFINGNNLVDGEIIIGETAKEVPESEFIKHQVTLDKTTVLLSINGTIGKVALYNNEPVILGKSASYMNCCPEVLPSYLVNYLTTSQAKKYYDLEVTGTTIFNLSLNSIRNMKVPLPPIDEQKGIVQFIAEQYSKYETLIQSSAKQNKLLKERRTALISAAVTGKIDVRNWQAPTVGAHTELSA
ncbi:restriction endonuclease subunit S [Acinetobacter radioresistens]|uniref:restriction endonuclease subunit S n=1 Tax=Acinetobacter radioresistens TaxID=40216 RepID=UPI0034D73958